MQSIKLFPALTVLRSNAFQTVTVFERATVINYMFTPACHCPGKRFFNFLQELKTAELCPTTIRYSFLLLVYTLQVFVLKSREQAFFIPLGIVTV